MRNSKSLKANFKFKYLSADIRAAENFAMALRSCDTLPVLYVAKKENGIWSEQRLRTFNQKFSPMVNANTDCYVSVNDFSLETEHRSNVGTTFINGLFFDTDFHKKSNTETDNGICRCIDILDREIENGNFPPLSMVTLTGRGIGKFIVYKQDIYTGDKKRVELHKKVYAATIRRLQKYWDEAEIEAEEDRSVTDFARVCRLPGTYNTKAKRYATLAYKDTKHLLTLEEIAQYFSIDELEYTETIEVEFVPVVNTLKKYDLDKKIFKYEQSQKAPFSDAKMSTFAIYEDNTIAQGCSIPAQESLSTDDKSPVRGTKKQEEDGLASKEMNSGSLSLFSQGETIPLAVIVFSSDYCVSKVTGG